MILNQVIILHFRALTDFSSDRGHGEPEAGEAAAPGGSRGPNGEGTMSILVTAQQQLQNSDSPRQFVSASADLGDAGEAERAGEGDHTAPG